MENINKKIILIICGMFLISGSVFAKNTKKLESSHLTNEVKKNEKESRQLERSLNMESDVPKIIDNCNKLIEIYTIRGDNRSLMQLKWLCESKLVIRKLSTLKLLEHHLLEGVGGHKDLYYYTLMVGYSLTGNLELSCKYYKKLSEEYADSFLNKKSHKGDIEKIIKAKKEIAQLVNKDISEDKRLWLLGNIYFNMLKLEWNEVEVGWDMSLAFEKFDELIKKYPKSEWVDNVEYFKLSHYEHMTHEGGDNESNLRNIDKYKKLIKKYPKSELIPGILIGIGSLYYYSIYPKQHETYNLKEVQEPLDLAKKVLNNVVLKYPNYKDIQRAQKLLEDIKEFEDNLKVKADSSN